jgi:hypothetical protein
MGGDHPYLQVAAALEELSASRSRLLKERVLVNLFRVCLALEVSERDLVAVCYLLAPVKDSQSGGHHLVRHS